MANTVGRPINLVFEIAKVDEERRQVWGYATVQQPDKQATSSCRSWRSRGHA